MTKDRRRSERARTRVSAKVTQIVDDTVVSGFTRDISAGGLFVLTRKPFAPGSKVKVELDYRDRKVGLAGVVVHAAQVPYHLRALQSSGMGIAVDQPSRAGSDRTQRDASADTETETETEVVAFFGSERHLLALRDLSASGAAVVSDFELPDVSFMRLHLRLEKDAEVIELDGVPVRSESVDDGTLTAIEFLDPPDEVVAKIEEFSNRNDGNS